MQLQILLSCELAHQNRTIAIASDLRVDGAKSPEFPQKEVVLGSEIAARNRKSLATFHRTLKSQCSIAVSCLGHRAISGVRDGHPNRKSQKSLRFRCAKSCEFGGIFEMWELILGFLAQGTCTNLELSHAGSDPFNHLLGQGYVFVSLAVIEQQEPGANCVLH